MSLTFQREIRSFPFLWDEIREVLRREVFVPYAHFEVSVERISANEDHALAV